jgi:hypothetical protein
MRIRRFITAAVVVAATSIGLVATVGTPGYAIGRSTCTTYDQGGFTGDVCVQYLGLGEGRFIGNGHAQSYPGNCATFRIDLIDPDGSRVQTTGPLACHTGTIGSVGFPAIGFVKERAFARLTSFDGAGNSILSVQTDILASPFSPVH